VLAATRATHVAVAMRWHRPIERPHPRAGGYERGTYPLALVPQRWGGEGCGGRAKRNYEQTVRGGIGPMVPGDAASTSEQFGRVVGDRVAAWSRRSRQVLLPFS